MLTPEQIAKLAPAIVEAVDRRSADLSLYLGGEDITPESVAALLTTSDNHVGYALRLVFEDKIQSEGIDAVVERLRGERG